MTNLQVLYSGIHDFFFEPSGPVNLAVCRIFFYGGVLLLYVCYDRYDIHNPSEWCDVSKIFWQPVWWFKYFRLPLLSKRATDILWFSWLTSLLLSCLGLFTSLSTTIAFLLGFYLLGLRWNFGSGLGYPRVGKTDNCFVLILGILALSKCGDFYSLDNLILSHPPEDLPRQSGEYTWPIRMVWLVTTCIFCSAGLAKLTTSGFRWIFSNHLTLTFQVANYINPKHYYNFSQPARSELYHGMSATAPLTPWGLYLARYDWFCRFLAFSVVIVELGFFLALPFPHFRPFFVGGMILCLIGFPIFHGPMFPQLMLSTVVFWTPWTSLTHLFT